MTVPSIVLSVGVLMLIICYRCMSVKDDHHNCRQHGHCLYFTDEPKFSKECCADTGIPPLVRLTPEEEVMVKNADIYGYRNFDMTMRRIAGS
jgi:hypothetical protein